MNIFSNMNRKQKREFNSLDNDKKAELIQSALVEKVSGVMAKETAKSMIRGMEFQLEELYTKYVMKMDDFIIDGDFESSNKINEELLSFLRMKHLEFIKKYDGFKEEE